MPALLPTPYFDVSAARMPRRLSTFQVVAAHDRFSEMDGTLQAILSATSRGWSSRRMQPIAERSSRDGALEICPGGWPRRRTMAT